MSSDPAPQNHQPMEYVDKDVDEDPAAPPGAQDSASPGAARTGGYAAKDVPSGSTGAAREGDYVDKDVPVDEIDTSTGSYVATDPG